MTPTVLVTGVTGYLGSRLVPRLLDDGHRVRVLTRDAGKVEARAWRDRVEVVEGDASSAEVLGRALDGVEVAYYLLHSMDGRPGFAERDRELAATLRRRRPRRPASAASSTCPACTPMQPGLSEHLASRVEVGEILMRSGVPTAVLQAAVIIGSGSASFEMLRQLTRRLPAMLTPKWLDNRIQPIAVRDVLHYLAAAVDLPGEVNRTFDVGGPDVLTYRQMIQRFARIAGLRRRLIVTVPVLTPRLASLWVGFVTPVPSAIARPLVGSLVHEVVCAEHDLDAHGRPATRGRPGLRRRGRGRCRRRRRRPAAGARHRRPRPHHRGGSVMGGLNPVTELQRLRPGRAGRPGPARPHRARLGLPPPAGRRRGDPARRRRRAHLGAAHRARRLALLRRHAGAGGRLGGRGAALRPAPPGSGPHPLRRAQRTRGRPVAGPGRAPAGCLPGRVRGGRPGPVPARPGRRAARPRPVRVAGAGRGDHGRQRRSPRSSTSAVRCTPGSAAATPSWSPRSSTRWWSPPAASRCWCWPPPSLGLVVGLQRRVTGGILGPIVTHLTWSLGMLFLLPHALSAFA